MLNSTGIDKKVGKFTSILPVMSLLIIGLYMIISASATADNGDHMDGGGMMDWGWWEISMMWLWMIGYWIIFVIIGILVYKDAQDRGMSGLLWFILVILPLLGVLFLIIYLVIREDKTAREIPQKSANTILDERYARGEITQEEYMKIKKDISGR